MSRAARRIASCAILIAWALGSSSARADEAPTKKDAGRLLEEGNKLYARRRYLEALDRYEAAARAFPSPKIAFNLAKAHEALGHSPIAANLYVQFMSSGGLAPGAAAYEQARVRLEGLDAVLGRIELFGPEGCAVEIDGDLLGVLPLPAARVWPGSHKVTLTAPDLGPTTLALEVGAGESTRATLPLELARAEPPPSTPDPVPTASVAFHAAPPPPLRPPVEHKPALVVAPPPQAEDGGILSRWWFWTIIGATVIAGSAAVFVLASEQPVPSGHNLGVSSTADGWTAD